MFSAIQQSRLEDHRSFAATIPNVPFAKILQEPGEVTPITQNAEIHSVVHAAPITALSPSTTIGICLDIWA